MTVIKSQENTPSDTPTLSRAVIAQIQILPARTTHLNQPPRRPHSSRRTLAGWHCWAASPDRRSARQIVGALEQPEVCSAPLEWREVGDFHALRNWYISDVICTGADLKQAMMLSRHADPRFTASRYARARLHDLGAVVNILPKSTPRRPENRQP